MKKKTLSRFPPRFASDLPVKFRLASSATELQNGRLVNLSAVGVCLRSKAKLYPGEIIEMIIESIDKKGLKRRRIIRGKIAWVKGEKAGLEFAKTGKTSPASTRGSSSK